MLKLITVSRVVFGVITAMLLLASESGAAAESNKAAKRTPFASSGKTRVSVIELYTSESCSSCPPADKWVSALTAKPGLFTSFVPVVFHVDYWNDLGWKDGFSSNLMTRRQQEVANTWARPVVYTPGFVFNGREWRDRDLESSARNPGKSELSLNLFKEANGRFSVTIDGLKPGQTAWSI